MKAIVTGGAGFIGSHLVEELLKEKYEITVIDNFSTGRLQNLKNVKNDIEVIECDISVKGDWQKKFSSVDYIFHLAALADIVPSIQNPDKYFNSNVVGTYNMLEVARNYNIKKFVYSASSSCYGIPDNYPTKETDPIDPKYPYALTKRMGEELLMHWSELYKIPSISLRFFNVYGPRSRTTGAYGAVFGVFLAQKLSGKPYTVVGDGKQTRDFTFVTDIVSALMTASKGKESNKIYNVGSGKTVSINKIIDLLEGKKVFIPKRPGEPDCTFGDIKKITKELGWKPHINIEQGIKMLLETIDDWKDAPVWTAESIAFETKDWFKYLSND